MSNGRIKNSLRNVMGAVLNKFSAIVFPFIIRTIILYYLGTEYAGLSSLFTSILQILSLSELGIGSAIVFSMYKPVAEEDIPQINALLGLYRKIYLIIGCCILFIGIVLLPFIPYLISGSYPEDINLFVLYAIYLCNTVASYFLYAYKSSVLIAYQRSDIESNITTFVNIGMYLMQIIVLVMFRNYYLYIIFLPIATVIINVIRSIVVDKKYPRIYCEGEVSKETRRDISKRVGALIGHQLSGTVNCSLDNIVVSIFLGLTVVAQYGNYYYIVSALAGIMQVVFNSLTASVGNSLIKETKEKNLRDFFDMQYINCWVVGWISICMLCLYQDFMRIWVGEKFLFSFDIVFLFVLYFYSWQTRRTVLTYKNAFGMWWIDKVKPYVSICVNLVLNFTLVRIIGVYGVLLSTIICYACVEAPWETNAFFKEYFKSSSLCYWKKLIKFTIITVVCMFVTYKACQVVLVNGMFGLVIKGIICGTLPNIMWIIVTHKEMGFKRIVNIMKMYNPIK